MRDGAPEVENEAGDTQMDAELIIQAAAPRALRAPARTRCRCPELCGALGNVARQLFEMCSVFPGQPIAVLRAKILFFRRTCCKSMFGNQVIENGVECDVKVRGNRRETARISVKQQALQNSVEFQIVAFQRNHRAPHSDWLSWKHSPTTRLVMLR